VLKLALIAEPLERQWNESFLDLAFGAWSDVLAEARRKRALPESQRRLEEILEAEAKAAASRQALCAVFRRRNVVKLSGKQLQVLLQQLVPSEKSEDVALCMERVPREPDGRAAGGGPPGAAGGEQDRSRWLQEWKASQKQCHQARLRRRGIFALALISEPREWLWDEVFLDLAWSAWSEVVALGKREMALPPAQRLFEQGLEDSGLCIQYA